MSLSTPLHERFNRSIEGFDANYVQPFPAAATANHAANDAASTPQSPSISAQGGLTFEGVGGDPAGLYHTPKNGIMPRAGLSWQFGRNSPIRAGMGMFQGFLGVRHVAVNQSRFS
jgi:hypothetical protein